MTEIIYIISRPTFIDNEKQNYILKLTNYNCNIN